MSHLPKIYHDPNRAVGPNTTKSFLRNPLNTSTDPSDPGPLPFGQKDHFFSYQLMSTNGPYGLDNESLWAAGIIDDKHRSRTVLHTMQKIGVVVKEKGNTVDTTKIGPQFVHQMTLVPARQQKMIVDLLFWWEEECARLRKLEDEKEEIETLLKRPGLEEQGKIMMKALLDRINMKLRAKPSQRDEKMERDEDELMMRFREGMSTCGGGAQAGENPPAYSKS